MTNGKSTLLVSLDYIAAFDSIDHSILLDLSLLEHSFGFTGTALTWLQSYLCLSLLRQITIGLLPLPLPLVSRVVLF